MGVGSDSIKFIRQFFRDTEYHRPPYVPVAGYQGLGTQSNQSFGINSGSIPGLTDHLRIDADLVASFMDYEDQDDSPLISSAIDIYADDASQVDAQTGKSVWIKAEDEDVRAELDDLLHKRLDIEQRVWSWVRMLCKYGNLYAEIVAKAKAGVVAVNMLAPPTVRRIEIPKEIGRKLEDGREDHEIDTLGFIYDPRGSFRVSSEQFLGELEFRATGRRKPAQPVKDCAIFESWEVVHMRLMGKNPLSPYGHGIGEPARWVFKRLLLLEDSIIMHRLSRAPSRYAFYVDVSGIPPNESMSYLQRVKQSFKKQKFVNPNSGKMDRKFDVLSADEDFFLPMRDGKESTRVESLQGPIYDHIEDIKFFENKLFAALKVPKPFLTYEESTAKTNLSAEDSRFARTVIRVQREFRNGIKHICKVHLAAKGVNPDAVEFDVEMTVPSAIFELAQLEIRAAELDLADKYKPWAPDYWIKTHVLGWSDDQIREMNLKGDSDESEVPSGGTGDLEKALAKRGTPSSPSEPEASEPMSGGEEEPVTASKDTSLPILSQIKRNTDSLIERTDRIQAQDKTSGKKWEQLKRMMEELQHSVDRSTNRK
jgi:hypothetical protein